MLFVHIFQIISKVYCKSAQNLYPLIAKLCLHFVFRTNENKTS